MTASPEPSLGLRVEAALSADWRRAAKAALLAFLLSRVVVLVSAGFAVAVSQQWEPSGAQEGLWLFDSASRDTLEQRVVGNDASWYLTIAQSGYETRTFDVSRQANWAFFPLHPWAWGVLIRMGIDPAVGGMVLAHLFFLLGMFQLHRWIQLIRDRATADRAVLSLALFPTAYFFSLPWTESLFLLLSASALLAISRSHLGSASLWGALLSATRPTGVLMAGVIWWEGRRSNRSQILPVWVFSALASMGLLLFMGWLWFRTGNPLAFVEIQTAWGRGGGSVATPFLQWAATPLQVAEQWNMRLINGGALVLALAAAVWLWRNSCRGLALLVILTVLAPWSTGTLTSMGRYVLTCLPVFLVLACWLDKPWLMMSWLILSTFMLSLMSGWFALGFSFAGA